MKLSTGVLVYKIVILSIAIGLPTLMLFHISNPVDFLMIIAGVSVMLICALPMFVKKNYFLLEPMTLVTLIFLQSVTLKIGFIISFQLDPKVQSHNLLGKDPSFMLKTLLILVVGVAFMVAGYMFPAPLLKGRKWIYMNSRRVWHKSRFYLGIGGVCVLALLGMVLFIRSLDINLLSVMDNISGKRFTNLKGDSGDKGANQRLQFVGYYYFRLAHFARYAFYISLAFAVSTGKRIFSFTGFLVIFSLGISLFVAFFTSDRSATGWLFLEGFFIFALLQNRIKLGYVAVLPLLVFMSSVVILSERSERRSEQSSSELITSTLGGRDQIDITKTSQIIDHVPVVLPYNYGQTLYGWIFAPVPRSVWPTKPLFMQQPNVISKNVYGLSGTSGVYPGLPAELYWNFNVFGVWFGLLFFGWVQKLIYVNYVPYKRSPIATVIYVVMLTHFSFYFLCHSFGFGILKIVLNLIPIILIFKFITKKVPISASPNIRQ